MIIEIVLSILFNRCASLQVDLIISISTRSTQVFSTAFVSSISSCLCFSHPPSLCFFEDPDFFIKYPFILVKSHHSFPSIFLSGDSHEDRNGASSYHSLSFLFSGGFKSRFVDYIPFFSFQIPSLDGAPHIYSFLAILLFRSAQDISKIRVSTLLSFKFFRGCSLIQAI